MDTNWKTESMDTNPVRPSDDRLVRRGRGADRLRQAQHRYEGMQPFGEKMWVFQALRQQMHGGNKQNESERDVVGAKHGGEIGNIAVGFAGQTGNHAFLQDSRNNDAGDGRQSDKGEFGDPVLSV